jgi:signal recognition particle receptor subunit beta
MDANEESVYNLKQNLKEQGYNLAAIPYVLQLNKRDLPNITPVDEMTKLLRQKDEPIFEAVASKGTGVFDTLKTCAKLTLQELRKNT